MTELALMTRREALAGLGAGLAIGLFPLIGATSESSGQIGSGPRALSGSEEQPSSGLHPNVMVHVARDGQTTIVCHRSEMGQGVRSTIPLLIADELGADPARVRVRQADGDAKYGDQNTDGSSSIRKFYEDLRRAGAVVRTLLIAAAAQHWHVKPESCSAKNHQVVHLPSKRALPFGELVDAAAKLPIPKQETIVLRPESELVHVNDPNLPVLDALAIVTGSAVFGADVRLPNLLIAVIARPPAVGSKWLRYDGRRALAVPGVKRIVEMPAPQLPWSFQPWGGIAVVANNTWAALRGRAELDITWDPGPNASYDSTPFRDELLASVRAPGKVLRDFGDVEAAFAKAAKVVEAEYHVPHLSHLQMEPLVACARVEADRCEVWAPTQNPQDARKEVARVLDLPEDQVTVHVTLLGGGFGRKSKADFVSEAAFLAKACGVPIRVQWTREDDVRHDYYNAVNAQRLRAAFDEQGRFTAWHHRTAFTPIGGTFKADVDTPTLYRESAVRATLTDLPVLWRHNPVPDRGLASSIALGVGSLGSDATAAIICLGDMPYVRASHLAALAEAFLASSGKAICVPTFRGRRGNPVLWPAHWFEQLARLQGDQGARSLLAAHLKSVRWVPVSDPGVLVDIDSTEDLIASEDQYP